MRPSWWLPLILAAAVHAETNLTASQEKPLIIFVPDVFYSSLHFSLLQLYLSRSGQDIAVSLLPSSDQSDDSAASAAKDAIYVKTANLGQAIDQGVQVVLAMHGYGAIPASVAASGLSVRERRARGKQGGILGMISVGGILAQKDESWLDKVSNSSTTGSLPPWISRSDATTVKINSSLAPDSLFNEVRPYLTQSAINFCRSHSLSALTSRSEQPAWASQTPITIPGNATNSGNRTILPWDGRLIYLTLTKDRTLSVSAQMAMIGRASTQTAWETHAIQAFVPDTHLNEGSDHSPMLSRMEALGAWIQGFSAKWVAEQDAEDRGDKGGTSLPSAIPFPPVLQDNETGITLASTSSGLPNSRLPAATKSDWGTS